MMKTKTTRIKMTKTKMMMMMMIKVVRFKKRSVLFSSRIFRFGLLEAFSDEA